MNAVVPPARTASLLRAAVVLALVLGLLAPAGAAHADCHAEPEEGFRMLFDGTPASLEGWRQAGPGNFEVVDCTLESVGGMGLLWYAAEEFSSYTLRAEWKIAKAMDNSGIFVGFPDAGDDPWVAVNQGYEIQIDQFGRMDGQPEHYTGAIYDIQGPNRDTRLDPRGWTDWNTYEITVDDPTITVELNGEVVNEFISIDPQRDLSRGHVGLQNHANEDTTYFRNIQIKELGPGQGNGGQDPGSGALTSLRNNTGIAQDPGSNADFDGVGYSYSAQALQLEGVTPGSTVEADGMEFTWPDTDSGRSDNVVASGQVIDVHAPPGATRLGLLAAADHGPSTGIFQLTYAGSDESGISTEIVEREVTVSDWTLNGGGAPASPGNVIAITTPWRSQLSTVPNPIDTHVFAVTIGLDPTRRLESVKLPLHTSGRLHVFDLSVE